jgi:hypothetical protein
MINYILKVIKIVAQNVNHLQLRQLVVSSLIIRLIKINDIFRT